MAQRCEYQLTLKLVSPFLFESIVNARVGVDSAQMKDEAGRPIIPAAQVKGILRDAMETLADRTELVSQAEIGALFGKSSDSAQTGGNEPFRAAAIFSDLAADELAPQKMSEDDGKGRNVERTTTRIEIDDETGAVKRGALQVIELAAPFGKQVAFSGKLIIRYPRALDRKRCEHALRKAIRLVPAIGAMKSAGFGMVERTGCDLALLGESDLALPASAAPSADARRVYAVEFDRPVLVDARYITENLFQSAKIIPGAVFKGALAERLALSSEMAAGNRALSEEFALLRLSHAFPLVRRPEDQTMRWRVAELPIPMSIVCRRLEQKGAGTEEQYEYADAIAEGLGEAPLWGDEFPAFVSGAKKEVQSRWRDVANTPEWDVDLLPRTHIAMNERGETAANLRRMTAGERVYTAADHLLYTTAMLPVRGQKWQVTVDTGRMNDKELAARLVAAIEQGLDGFGKTGARASFTPFDAATQDSSDRGDLPDRDHVDIMLKTPAVMFDAAKDQDLGMVQRYQTYFEKTFQANLRNVYARQSMSGGYQAKRRRPYGAYYPFVLTEAGSVFRLGFAQGGGRDRLAQALRFGLPVPELGGNEAAWHNCPFVRENGYGEIMLHAPTGVRQHVLTFVREVGRPD